MTVGAGSIERVHPFVVPVENMIAHIGQIRFLTICDFQGRSDL